MNAAIEKKKGNRIHGATGFRGYLKNPVLTLMFIPVVIYYIVFHYTPMYGIVLAFKDYSLTLGIMKSPWIPLLCSVALMFFCFFLFSKFDGKKQTE